MSDSLSQKLPSAEPSRGRPRPAIFRALGSADLPGAVEVDGELYHHRTTFKHDSWAATGLYQTWGKSIVCKFHRTQPIFGLPMRWLGRRVAAHETHMLRTLDPLDNVPDLCGPVQVAGRSVSTAVARVFIPGQPLSHTMDVGRAFFGELGELLAHIHQHGMAYVDLHKPENVLVGEDGRPYLIDFQISVHPPRLWPFTLLLKCLQQSDEYHLYKHKVRHGLWRDDAALARVVMNLKRPWWIRLHRSVAVPFRTARRRLLVLLGVRRGRGRVETEHQPEVAFRQRAA
jgi:hypothetical protein